MELNRLRFHWGTRTAREEEDMDNIGAVERDGDEGEVVVDWDSLPDDLGRDSIEEKNNLARVSA